MATVAAGIGPALEGTLPGLELGSADVPRWAGSARERRRAHDSGFEERHDEAAEELIDSHEEQLRAVADGVG